MRAAVTLAPGGDGRPEPVARGSVRFGVVVEGVATLARGVSPEAALVALAASPDVAADGRGRVTTIGASTLAALGVRSSSTGTATSADAGGGPAAAPPPTTLAR